MASTIWRKQFTPLHCLIKTSVAGGATLHMTDEGYPRIAFPLQASGDIGVVLPIGILAELYAELGLKVRVRLYANETGKSHQFGVRFMAKRPGSDGGTEAFNATETLFTETALPATAGEIHDLEVTVPIGTALDNAQLDDSLYMLLTLKYDTGRTSSESMLIEQVETWQELP